MCVKFLLGDLNPDPCPPHPISTYTCEVTITLRVYGGEQQNIKRVSNVGNSYKYDTLLLVTEKSLSPTWLYNFSMLSPIRESLVHEILSLTYKK